MEKKESSLRSIGSGDLSFSHLGLPDLASNEASPASSKFPDLTDQRARSESAPVDSSQAPSIDLAGEGATSRPRSLIEPVSGSVDDLPPYDQVDGKLGLHRNSSLRSNSKTHRKRGSSVATAGTGTTIGAAIAAANSSLAVPSGGAGAPKLTGFAIASKKRNRDFHSIFKSVPDDDYLIEDYSCALQREILAHGRLYVSEGHLCFSSNILGWTTTLVMSFDEIVSVEKRSTALLFKNGLMISTLHAKHIFASFTSRDATYDLIVNIWKLGHPTLTSTLNGVRLEGTGGDKTERPDNEGANEGNESQLESDSGESSGEEDSEYYDSDENEETSEHGQPAESAITAGEPVKSVARKASAPSPPGSTPVAQSKEAPAASTGEADFPGPTTHAPTDCGDSASHYDKIVGDEIIPAPLGKVYNLLFGPPSSSFMGKWLTVEQKCTELQMEDKKGLLPGNTTRTYSYIKPLGGSIGPKQTKCIVTETLDNLDLEKSANFNVSTQTPDVPSGNVFVIKTRYCLSWAENNATRLQMNCTVEWSGKSWLKGNSHPASTIGCCLSGSGELTERQVPSRRVRTTGRRNSAKIYAPLLGLQSLPSQDPQLWVTHQANPSGRASVVRRHNPLEMRQKVAHHRNVRQSRIGVFSNRSGRYSSLYWTFFSLFSLAMSCTDFWSVCLSQHGSVLGLRLDGTRRAITLTSKWGRTSLTDLPHTRRFGGERTASCGIGSRSVLGSADSETWAREDRLGQQHRRRPPLGPLQQRRGRRSPEPCRKGYERKRWMASRLRRPSV
jgi:hypothetical protein